ncbi:zinc ribbon domain-containing protein [Thermosyntropha lipolytica]|uniref:zinc ribbon domain-containing protein n=1 Tax=Thermosyntropha lipolytica TaxID=54294 RepID=UPI00241FFAE3|nr:zinc ribbon domain-containing protein [Thermosyntropha lipolytica]
MTLNHKDKRERGSKLIIAPRFYPSSKKCSNCGYILPELKLSTRQWECPECRAKHDRDINAAINLMQYANIA